MPIAHEQRNSNTATYSYQKELRKIKTRKVKSEITIRNPNEEVTDTKVSVHFPIRPGMDFQKDINVITSKTKSDGLQGGLQHVFLSTQGISPSRGMRASTRAHGHTKTRNNCTITFIFSSSVSCQICERVRTHRACAQAHPFLKSMFYSSCSPPPFLISTKVEGSAREGNY